MCDLFLSQNFACKSLPETYSFLYWDGVYCSVGAGEGFFYCVRDIDGRWYILTVAFGQLGIIGEFFLKYHFLEIA